MRCLRDLMDKLREAGRLAEAGGKFEVPLGVPTKAVPDLLEEFELIEAVVDEVVNDDAEIAHIAVGNLLRHRAARGCR